MKPEILRILSIRKQNTGSTIGQDVAFQTRMAEQKINDIRSGLAYQTRMAEQRIDNIRRDLAYQTRMAEHSIDDIKTHLADKVLR
jgi:hypothetical protein